MATLQDLIINFKTLYTDSGLIQPDLNTLLLHKISQNSGGGGGGGSSGTQYLEGLSEAPATGTVLLFRRTDGTLKALQGDNSDRIKTIADVSNLFALDTTAVAIRDRLPSALGATTAANSFPVTLATDGAFALAFGAATDASAGTDSANTGFISLFKRLLSRLTTLFQGTAGTPNNNVITVQGITSGTAIAVSQSAPTNLTRSSISVSASGDTTIVTGVTAQRVKIYGLVLIANGDVNVTIKGAATSLTGALPLGSKGNGFVIPVNSAVPWIQTGLADALIINLSAAVQVSGFIVYAQEA